MLQKPDTDRAFTSQLLQMIGKNREMVRFTEKRGQICRQGIDETLPLVSTSLFEHIQIVAKGILARSPQTPSQARIDHILLDRRQGYPGVLVNQFADTLEVGAGKAELALPLVTPELSQAASSCNCAGRWWPT